MTDNTIRNLENQFFESGLLEDEVNLLYTKHASDCLTDEDKQRAQDIYAQHPDINVMKTVALTYFQNGFFKHLIKRNFGNIHKMFLAGRVTHELGSKIHIDTFNRVWRSNYLDVDLALPKGIAIPNEELIVGGFQKYGYEVVDGPQYNHQRGDFPAVRFQINDEKDKRLEYCFIFHEEE